MLWFSLLTGVVMAFMFTAQYGVRLLGTYPFDAIDFPRWLALTFAIDLASVFCLTVLLAGLASEAIIGRYLYFPFPFAKDR